MASGVVIALLGLFIVLRTISSGGGNGNLADWLLGLGGNSSPPSSSTGAPNVGATATKAGAAVNQATTGAGAGSAVGQLAHNAVPTLGGIGHRNTP